MDYEDLVLKQVAEAGLASAELVNEVRVHAQERMLTISEALLDLAVIDQQTLNLMRRAADREQRDTAKFNEGQNTRPAHRGLPHSAPHRSRRYGSSVFGRANQHAAQGGFEGFAPAVGRR